MSTLSTLPLTAALGFLMKKWLSERLSGSIKYEYDQRLEEFRQGLQRSNAIALEAFRAQATAEKSVELERLRSSLSIEAQKSIRDHDERRRDLLVAIEAIYSALIDAHDVVSDYTAFAVVLDSDKKKAVDAAIRNFERIFYKKLLYVDDEAVSALRTAKEALVQCVITYQVSTQNAHHEPHLTSFAKAENDVLTALNRVEAQLRATIYPISNAPKN